MATTLTPTITVGHCEVTVQYGSFSATQGLRGTTVNGPSDFATREALHDALANMVAGHCAEFNAGWREGMNASQLLTLVLTILQARYMEWLRVEHGVTSVQYDGRAYDAAPARNELWCQCGAEETFGSYPQDGECSCGMHKHHVHCGTCGLISQIG